jgi:hypothetical protein
MEGGHMKFPTRVLCLIAIVAAAAATASPTLDAAGKCRDNGRFVEAKRCATPKTGGKCRDVKTKKFARCGMPGTEPVSAGK